MTTNFVHLHNHSEFSALDGLGTVEEYVERAKELGQTALALTDHGNLCGVPHFYNVARKAGIEPIIGEEFYFVDSAQKHREEKTKGERCHVVLLARGRAGYEVLSEISSASHAQFYYKPLLDVALIEQLSDAERRNIVCLSGCAASPISEAILLGKQEEAVEQLIWWREHFDHFYIELQSHGTSFDRELNQGLIRLAKRYQIPHVLTNDPHYVYESDAGHHDTLLALQTASDIDDPDRFRFEGSGYHLRSRAEMRAAFSEYHNEIWTTGAAHTVEIAKLCRTRIPQWEKRTWHIPQFPDTDNPNALLRKLAKKGLRERGLERDSVYRLRMDEELKAFEEMGLADFLLITWDCIEFAKSGGAHPELGPIPVGPGRGSVCGTLVGYLIGIHKIDPIKYDLLFSRFLNPSRPKMPDIDTDFGPTRRSELFDYVAEKYGADNTALVAAYHTMRAKGTFKRLAKSFGVSFVEANNRARGLPEIEGHGSAASAEQAGGDEDFRHEENLPESIPKDFRDWVTTNYPGLAKAMLRLVGTKTGAAAHPAGVIIADEEANLRHLVPLMYLASSKRMCGQFDLDAVEEMGLMKQDFLGLRNLETIAEAVRLIEETTDEVIDPDDWIPDEEEGDQEFVYPMLTHGHTAGVFQMEGETNTRGIKEVKCTCFEDIVTTTSLYRTGALVAGFPKQFIANRSLGRKNRIQYIHESLRPILDRTWGVVAYQEQVMEMGEKIAGFDMGLVDDIKEAIKHKKSTLMDSMGPMFIRGAQQTVGCTKQQATDIWKLIVGYSGYGYNRSHAVAYTFVSYQTARLKALWPAQYIVALLRTVDDKDKRKEYLREAVRFELKIYGPDIQLSEARSIAARSGIRFGFEDIAGIGKVQARKIVNGRPEGGYESVEQLLAVVNNSGVMTALAECGALRSLGVKGNRQRKNDLLGWQFYDPHAALRSGWEELMMEPYDDGQECQVIGEITTANFKGSTKSGKPYGTIKIRFDETREWAVRLWSETQKVWPRLTVGSIVQVSGVYDQQWNNVTGKKIKVLVEKKKADATTSA